MIHHIVHNRLRIQRGIAFVAIFVSTLTLTGVWRIHFPNLSSLSFFAIAAILYLSGAWLLGWIDEKYLWRVENDRHIEMNPAMVDIIERLERIERELRSQRPL
jgi:hypothetical protein